MLFTSTILGDDSNVDLNSNWSNVSDDLMISGSFRSTTAP